MTVSWNNALFLTRNLFSCIVFDFQMDHLIESVKDSNLRLTLSFGIGMHHAGLHERDRKTVEELFCNQKIQVSIYAPSSPRSENQNNIQCMFNVCSEFKVH